MCCGVAAAVWTGDVEDVGGGDLAGGGVWGRGLNGGLVLSEAKGMAGVLAFGALCGMPESVVADFVEAFGEHMLEESAHELVSSEGAGGPLLVLAVFVPERDGAVVHGEDAPVGDGDAVDVTGEVVEHGGLALSPRLAPGDPVSRPYVGG